MDNKKSSSKSNLNESTLPLLDDDVNKEKIELKGTTKEETDEAAEKSLDGDKQDETEAAKKKKEEKERLKKQKKLEEEEKKKQLKIEKELKKQEEKELKKQKKAEKKAAQETSRANGSISGNEANGNKNWNLYDQFTVGINLLDRDEKSINEHVNVSFEDIVGEPDATQGFESAYRLSFGLFQFVRFWIYRILMVVFAVPLALLWALIFALLSVLSVWILTPGFRFLDILFFYIHRLWNNIVRTFLDPVFSSLSLVKSQTKPLYSIPTATNSGRSVVYKDGMKYNKVSSNETMETYKSTSNDVDPVTLQIDS